MSVLPRFATILLAGTSILPIVGCQTAKLAEQRAQTQTALPNDYKFQMIWLVNEGLRELESQKAQSNKAEEEAISQGQDLLRALRLCFMNENNTRIFLGVNIGKEVSAEQGTVGLKSMIKTITEFNYKNGVPDIDNEVFYLHTIEQGKTTEPSLDIKGSNGFELDLEQGEAFTVNWERFVPKYFRPYTQAADNVR